MPQLMALRYAAAAGQDVRGAIAYVTLEPCAHQGRTGPCCDALVAAGIGHCCGIPGRPQPAGGWLRALPDCVWLGGRRGGTRCCRITGVEHGVFQPHGARHAGCGSRWQPRSMARQRCTNHPSQWITSPAARADGHAWRARACAVLTGIGTVLADNPRLDVRPLGHAAPTPGGGADSHLLTNPNAHLFIASRACTIYAAGHFDSDFLARKAALEARGATVV